ncbi:glycoside hydrolase family 3 protein [Thermosulfurimonas marina]|uniref:beta-N-acetylhexosaminidase n=1 Tax=Thermosulfurimonas marina TaxID=2047767 RepID=A0A6H1WUC9_9BACT|nr:glycoside hydrolase family 3 protein [Thermosulfurimonas marina]QJA06781.1 glycoside hydrolase family 3 protein [Thermosulfurimonas marina]
MIRRLSAFLVPTLSGAEITPEEREILRDFGLRHLIFFSRHFEEAEAICTLREELGRLGLGPPKGFFMVDQEGGRVQRIGPPLLPDYPAPYELARKGPEEVSRISQEIARGLKALGLNVNLAPVVDLAGEEAPDWLRERTFGEDPERVGELAEVFIREHLKAGVLPCAKHFPGLGGVFPDPHRELPQKESPSEAELRVFKRATEAGVPLVMTTHLVVEAWDPRPVTFSERALRILREDLGFGGLVLTDDLAMGALSAWELAERLLEALLSGHDLWLIAVEVREIIEPLEALSREVEASRVLRERLVVLEGRQKSFLKTFSSFEASL